MIDKKGYDSLMAQIAKELKIDEQEVDQKLDKKYGQYKFFGKTATADKKKMEKQRAAEKKQALEKRRKIRERVHFTEFGGKKKVLKHILKTDFKDQSKKSKSSKTTEINKKKTTKKKTKTVSVSKADAKKSDPKTIVHSDARTERIAEIKTKMKAVRAGATFNKNATPSKGKSSPTR